MHVWNLLERALDLHPARTAVIDGGLRLSYREFAGRCRALSCEIRAAGLRAGERVAILDLNTARFLEAYFAAAGAGVVLVPLNFRLAPPEIAWILRDSGARLLLANLELAELARAALDAPTPVEQVLWSGAREMAPAASVFEPPATRPDELAHLYYTSGTTGRPKGVMLTHRNVVTHALAAIAELSLCERDVWGHFAPLYHLADAWATFAVTWAGGTHLCLPRFEESAVLGAIERERVTITNLVPTMLNRLVSFPCVERRDFTSLRRMLSGGAPIAPELVRRIMEVFRCEYVQTYGMTETSPYLTLSLLTEELLRLPAAEQFAARAKTGRPFLAVELRVVDEQGRPVESDGQCVGEIQARGETVTPGYWNRPEETAAAFTADGWLCTGDLATLDARGYLDIVDRKKDVILTGGETVYSTEVEHALAEHPAVLEAAVFGAPDPEWGECVRAAVVLRPGQATSQSELALFCRQRLGGFKVPRQIEFLPELPRTGSGKIQKSALRAAARGRACGP